ncbi:hypothetical protein [Chengkuizengella sediminis]|nr:hypothetical protein [Chengkuizengella sediminis]
MSNRGVKVVVQDPYYQCPNWLTKVKYKEYITLAKNTTKTM